MFLTRFSKATLIGITLLIAVLLSYLAFFNTPSIWDDYCFACTSREYGIWTAQKMYYEGWTGRYFTNFLFHINPLYFSDNRASFIVIPIVLFFGFIVNAVFFFKTILKEDKTSKYSFLLALAFVNLYYLGIPSIFESNFWMIGSYTFISGNMVILLLNLLIKRSKDENNLLLFSGIAFLYFLILGSSEISMLSGAIFIAFIVLQDILTTKKMSLQNTVLLIISVVGNLLVILAPGNAIRNPVKKPLLTTFMDTGKEAISFLLEWTLFSPLFMLATLAFVLFIVENGIPKGFKKVPFYQSLGVSFAMFFIAFVPTSFGIGGSPPPRILNLIYLLFLLIWFYNITLVCSYFISNFTVSHRVKNAVGFLTTFGFLLLTVTTKNIKQMYRDIRYDYAKNYLKEYETRITILTSSKEEKVRIPAFKSYPETLFAGGDITEDPAHLWNKCVAKYYNKKEVSLEPSTK